MRDLCKELLEMVRTELKAIVRETMLEVLQDEKRKSVYPERVSIVQASEITGYSKNSLYQMHSQGKVPGAHKVGSKLMFYTATLRKWVENEDTGIGRENCLSGKEDVTTRKQM